MAYTPILTNFGLSAYATAFSGGATVNVNTMVFGDGNGIEPIPLATQTALVHQTYSIALNSTTISGNVVTFQAIIPANAGALAIRECGLKDNLGNLIAVSAYPTTIIPATNNKELIVNFMVTISNASSVVLNINALNNKVDTVASSANLVHIIRQSNWLFNATNSITTGAIQIRINGLYAQTLSGTMKVLISQNSTTAGIYPDYELGIAANWVAATGFINSEATMITNDVNPLTIRFGNDGVNCYIIIGETTTTWTNMRLVVKDVLANLFSTTYQPDFTFSIVTVLPSIIDSTQIAYPFVTATTLPPLAGNTLYSFYNLGGF